MYHENLNFMVENVTQIESGIKNCDDVSLKIQENIMCAKKLIFEILVHVLVKLVNIYKVLVMIQ